MTIDDIVTMAKENGADNAGLVDVTDIPFRREFRKACEQNICGVYGKCWMCPPDVGNIDEMIAKAKTYDKALVFQTISRLEDSFDFEGMREGGRKQRNVLRTLSRKIMPLLDDPLCLGAGACDICEKCARQTDEPCRFPEKATASLESYGVAVSELARASGLKYVNGENTVTYFGAFLFGGKRDA